VLHPFKTELGRLLLIALIVLLLGLASRSWGWALATGLAGYLLWLLWQLHLLDRWLSIGGAQPQSLAGVWRELGERMHRVSSREQERKERLAALIKRFRRTLEALPDPALILDPEGRVTWFNGAARRLFGFAYGGREARLDNALLQRLADEGAAQSVRFPAPVDARILLEARVVPLEQGESLLIARDITEQSRVQAMRRDFIANVSHELRTPLTVVTGYLDMLADEELPAELLEGILAANRQARRMGRIVADLLMLSRLEADDLPAPPLEPVAVASLLRELVTDAERLSGERDHTLLLSADAKTELLGSESELTSAFGNLIFNAVLHTPAGTAVSIYWGREDTGARLVVADQGPGIEPEHIRRLTERFYRVDKGRSRERGGTGLGLSIVHHVLRRHDARLDIQSTPGQGTRFVCHFTAARVRGL